MNNIAGKIEKISELLQTGVISINDARKLLNFPDIDMCWLVGNELLYFAANHTVKVLELK